MSLIVLQLSYTLSSYVDSGSERPRLFILCPNLVLLNFNVHTNNLGTFLNCRRLRRSVVQPEILLYLQAPRWCNDASLQTHIRVARSLLPPWNTPAPFYSNPLHLFWAKSNVCPMKIVPTLQDCATVIFVCTPWQVFCCKSVFPILLSCFLLRERLGIFHPNSRIMSVIEWNLNKHWLS